MSNTYSYGFVNKSSLQGIADSIRAKNGLSDTYKPSELPTAIDDLTVVNDRKLKMIAGNEGGVGNHTKNLFDRSSSLLVNWASAENGIGLWGTGGIQIVPYLTSILKPSTEYYVYLKAECVEYNGTGKTLHAGNLGFIGSSLFTQSVLAVHELTYVGDSYIVNGKYTTVDTFGTTEPNWYTNRYTDGTLNRVKFTLMISEEEITTYEPYGYKIEAKQKHSDGTYGDTFTTYISTHPFYKVDSTYDELTQDAFIQRISSDGTTILDTPVKTAISWDIIPHLEDGDILEVESTVQPSAVEWYGDCQKYHLERVYGAEGGVGEKTANMFDIANTETYKGYISTITVGSTITFGQSSRSMTAKKALYVHSGETLTYSYNSDISGDVNWAITDDDLKVLQSGKNDVVIGINSHTITATADGWLYFTYIISDWVMLNEGSTALPYEPYGYYKILITANGTTYTEYISSPLYADDYLTNSGTAIYSDGTKSSLGDPFDITVDNKSDVSFGTTVQPSKLGWVKGVNNPLTIQMLDGISGNSVQDGTPTPDAPVEIQSVGTYNSSTGKYDVVCKVKHTDGTYGNTYTASLDEPLRKVGDYADVLGPWGITRNILQLKNPETASWTATGTVNGYALLSSNYNAKSENIVPLSTRFNGTGGSEKALSNCFSQGTSSYGLRITPDYTVTESQSVDNLKTWLSNNPTEFYYVANTTTTEAVTWDKLPVMKVGDTLEVVSDIQPSAISYNTVEIEV